MNSTGLKIVSCCLILLAGCVNGGLKSVTDASSLLYLANKNGKQDLYLVTGSVEKLVNEPSHSAYHPALSPDGREVLYTAKTRTTMNIWKADLTSGIVQQLTDQSSDQLPKWSPDGKRIAFLSERDGTSHIYLMESDGTNRTRLTTKKSAESEMAWSPDGNTIAFLSPGSVSDGQKAHVMVSGLDGSDYRNLTAGVNAEHGQIAWSPDSGRVAYTSRRNRQFDIFVTDLATGKEANLTNSEQAQVLPNWSPDGKFIVFQGAAPGTPRTEIYSLDLKTNQISNLTNHPDQDVEPTFSRSGNLIGFVSHRDGNAEIYVMNVDGSEQTRLTHKPGYDWAPIVLMKRIKELEKKIEVASK